ncbi:unnamed protein product [Chrysodeixis includens]|uniref:Uncharacterized protein n=1 Tax=Chrysodeixis includens TaxID=689277 RepID=A0A9N8KUQ4_CHRIL|nr:unnamed protein product [Chrysodeixis includens]
MLAAWGQLIMDDLITTANGNKDCRGATCEYVRSAPTRNIDSCGFEHRDQMNMATSFLDGSVLYGSSEKELRSLRLYDAGKIDVDSCRKNAAQHCSQHTRLELSAWRDESGAKAAERLSQDMLATALEKAKQEMADRKKLEYMLWEARGGADPKSPVGTAASFSKANKYALKLANTSLFLEFATNELINSINSGHRRKRQIFDDSLGFGTSDFVDSLQSVDISGFLGNDQSGPIIEPQCDDKGPCSPDSPFRTYTGYCNNLRNPNLGKGLTTFARLLPPVYEDGVSRPRINSVTGTPLPSPRVVSTVIHPDISNLHTRYTLMTMQFAQFLDHELTMTPIHKGFHESIPDCRSCDSPRTVHPECNPFPVPRGDHYYPEVNVTSGERLCFPFMRSLPGQQQLGPREQVNQNTAFIDASVIYGENPCIVRKLRGFNGRLNATTNPINGRELLPRSDSHPECKAKSGFCFIAGYYKEYSPTCNPSIVTEFAAASFRFGHSLLRPHLPRLSPSFQPVEPPILLRDGFFRPDMFMALDLSAWRESSAQGCLIAGRSVAVGESAFPSPCTSCICTVEGAQCASLRITDCAQLQREWPREAVQRDDVCTAQCGASSGPASHAPARAPRRPNINFNFPDLSPFVAK